MLVVTTYVGQSIEVNGPAVIIVKKIKGYRTMQIAIDAPESTRILRSDAKVKVRKKPQMEA